MRRVPLILIAFGLLLWLGGCESRRDYDNRAEKLMENPPPAEPPPKAEEEKPYPSPDWYSSNVDQPELYTDPQTHCVYFITNGGYMTPRLDRRGRPLCPDRNR